MEPDSTTPFVNSTLSYRTSIKGDFDCVNFDCARHTYDQDSIPLLSIPIAGVQAYKWSPRYIHIVDSDRLKYGLT